MTPLLSQCTDIVDIKKIADLFNIPPGVARKLMLDHGNKINSKILASDGGVNVYTTLEIYQLLRERKEEIESMVVLEDDMTPSDTIPFKCDQVVYFLFNDNELAYIGQSMNITGRISQHLTNKSFNLVFCKSVDKTIVDTFEMANIVYHNPPLNCHKWNEEEMFQKALKHSVRQ
jgi:hypothetical protein